MLLDAPTPESDVQTVQPDTAPKFDYGTELQDIASAHEGFVNNPDFRKLSKSDRLTALDNYAQQQNEYLDALAQNGGDPSAVSEMRKVVADRLYEPTRKALVDENLPPTHDEMIGMLSKDTPEIAKLPPAKQKLALDAFQTSIQAFQHPDFSNGTLDPAKELGISAPGSMTQKGHADLQNELRGLQKRQHYSLSASVDAAVMATGEMTAGVFGQKAQNWFKVTPARFDPNDPIQVGYVSALRNSFGEALGKGYKFSMLIGGLGGSVAGFSAGGEVLSLFKLRSEIAAVKKVIDVASRTKDAARLATGIARLKTLERIKGAAATLSAGLSIAATKHGTPFDRAVAKDWAIESAKLWASSKIGHVFSKTVTGRILPYVAPRLALKPWVAATSQSAGGGLSMTGMDLSSRAIEAMRAEHPEEEWKNLFYGPPDRNGHRPGFDWRQTGAMFGAGAASSLFGVHQTHRTAAQYWRTLEFAHWKDDAIRQQTVAENWTPEQTAMAKAKVDDYLAGGFSKEDAAKFRRDIALFGRAYDAAKVTEPVDADADNAAVEARKAEEDRLTATAQAWREREAVLRAAAEKRVKENVMRVVSEWTQAHEGPITEAQYGRTLGVYDAFGNLVRKPPAELAKPTPPETATAQKPNQQKEGESSADKIKSSVEGTRGEPPGSAPQVAAGKPGELREPAGARAPEAEEPGKTGAGRETGAQGETPLTLPAPAATDHPTPPVGAVAARLPHKQKVAGSIPAPATTLPVSQKPADESSKTQEPAEGGAIAPTARAPEKPGEAEPLSGEGAKFSIPSENVVAAPPARGLPVEIVQSVADNMQRRFPGAAPVRVVEDGSQFPQSVKDAAARKSVSDLNRIEGVLAPDGIVYLNAAALGTTRRAMQVWTHEQIGHIGVDGLLNGIRPGSARTLEAMLAKHFPGEYRSAMRADPAAVVSETLARIAERTDPMSDIERTAWQKVLDFVRTILAKIGVKSWSEKDVRALLRRGLAKVRESSEILGLQSSKLSRAQEGGLRVGSPVDDYEGEAPPFDWNATDNYGKWTQESVSKHLGVPKDDHVYRTMIDLSDIKGVRIEKEDAKVTRSGGSEIDKQNMDDAKAMLKDWTENYEGYSRPKFDEWRDHLPWDPEGGYDESDVKSLAKEMQARQEESSYPEEDFSSKIGTGFPPIVVTRKANGSIVVEDGNHRADIWKKGGYDVAPAWVNDEMARLREGSETGRDIQSIVPAIRINGETIQGRQGDTHQDILNRLKAEDPEKWANALPDFDTKENPNFFVDTATGRELSREQLKSEFGVSHSQELREMQAKTPEAKFSLAQEEGTEEPQEPVGIKHAYTEKAAERFGLPGRIKQARWSNPQEWDYANQILASDPQAGERLVDAILSGEKKVTSERGDNGLLLHESVRRENELDSARNAYKAASDAAEMDQFSRPDFSDPGLARASLSRADDRLALARDEWNKVREAMDSAGSEQGRQFQQRQMRSNRDYTQAELERRWEKATGTRASEMSNAECAKMEKWAEETAAKITEATKRADAAEQALRDLQAQRVLDQMEKEFQATVKSAVKQVKAAKSSGEAIKDFTAKLRESALARIKARRGKLFLPLDAGLASLGDEMIIGATYIAEGAVDLAQYTAKMVETFGPRINQWMKPLYDLSKRFHDENLVESADKPAPSKTPPPPETSADVVERAKKAVSDGQEIPWKVVFDLARAKYAEGYRGLPILDAVHEELSKLDPELTKEDVTYAYTQYGKAKYPSEKEDLKHLAKVRELQRLQIHLDRMEEYHRTGIIPEGAEKVVPKSGRQFPKPTLEILEMRKEVRDKMAELGIETRDPEAELASRNQARANALRNRIAEMDKELATGIKPPKPPIVPMSGEVEDLTMVCDAYKAELDRIDAENNPPLSEAQKALDRALQRRERLQQILSGDLVPDAPKTREALTQMEEDVRLEADALQKLIGDLRRQQSAPTETDEAQSALNRALAAKERMQQILSGELAPDKPKPRKVLSQMEEDAKLETEAMRRLAAQLRRGPLRTPEQIYNDNAAKRVAKAYADVQARLARGRATGDYSRTPRPPPPALSKANTSAQADVKRLQSEADSKFREQERGQRHPALRILDWLARYKRFNVLTHLTSAARILTAGVSQWGWKPALDVLGIPLSYFAPDIAKKALSEAGWNTKAQARQYTETYKAIVNLLTPGVVSEIGKKFRTHNADIDFYDPKTATRYQIPPEFLDKAALFHAAIKEPWRQGLFWRSYEKQVGNILAQGGDPFEPLTEAHINEVALHDANRDILMGDNIISDFWQSMLRTARDSKKYPVAGKVLESFMQWLFPVVKVSSNFALIKLRLKFGLLESLGRIAVAQQQGKLANHAAGLSQAEADAIHRSFKMGMVGPMAFLFGAWAYQYFGGIWNPTEKRDKNAKLEPGEIMLPNGTIIPRVFSHLLPVSEMQDGASFARIYEQQAKTKGWASNGLSSIGAVLAGDLAEIPFIGVPKQLERPENWAYEQAANLIPAQGLLSDLAAVPDKNWNPMQRATKRKPQDLMNYLMMDIPGLRGYVPSKEALQQQAKEDAKFERSLAPRRRRELVH